MENTIIHAITKVYGILGYGLTETIYHKALVIELRNHFKIVEPEKPVSIIYEDHNVAILRADILINKTFLIELKATTKLTDKDEIQTKRYMQILNVNKGILVNFNKDLEIKEITL